MAIQNNRVPNQRIFCKCTYTTQTKIIKNGFQNKIQRYKCKTCGKNFQNRYQYKAYLPGTNKYLIQLLSEGVGVLSIARLLQISKNTVLSRILKIASTIDRPIWPKQNCKFQIDELWTFIQKKENGCYLIYGIEVKTGQVIDFSIGQRSYEKIGAVTNTVIQTNPFLVYTDRLRLYKNLLPKEKHKVFKYATNKIERNNLTIRTHVKRLARRTICFSKSLVHLEAHLKIYFRYQN